MVPVIQASGTPKTKWRTIDQPKNSRLYGSKSAQALLPHIVACFKPDMTQLWTGLDWTGLTEAQRLWHLFTCQWADLRPRWFVGNRDKKSLWSFARVVHQVNRARKADYAARTCERFAHSITKITRLTHFEKFHEARKGLWTFFLNLPYGCWLAQHANFDGVY